MFVMPFPFVFRKPCASGDKEIQHFQETSTTNHKAVENVAKNKNKLIKNFISFLRVSGMALPFSHPPRLCRMPCNRRSNAASSARFGSKASGGRPLSFPKSPIITVLSASLLLLGELVA